MTRETTETMREMMNRQTVVPAWMERMAREVGEDTAVTVTRMHTPFGAFVTAVVAAGSDA
jgi:hypothetical protein